MGDEISVSGQRFKVVGLIAYVNYATLHEKSTDMMFDAIKFDVAMVTQKGFNSLHKTVHYSYTWNYVDTPADEVEQKAKSDDFMKALLTQVVCADKELEDYMPPMQIRLLILQRMIWVQQSYGWCFTGYFDRDHCIYFCSDHQQHDREGGFYDRNTESFRLYER